VTTTVLLAKAVALALARHPIMNASCPDGSSFHYNGSINVAVAVAMDGGLITPVLPDADKVGTTTAPTGLCLEDKKRTQKKRKKEKSCDIVALAFRDIVTVSLCDYLGVTASLCAD